jgi:molybdopterin/thiamine biosynthesis adenylyltransferase
LIVITAELLAGKESWEGAIAAQFRSMDEGDAFSTINVEGAGNLVGGTIHVCSNGQPDVSQVGRPHDQVRVLARRQVTQARPHEAGTENRGKWQARGYVRREDSWAEVAVSITPVRAGLFARAKGLLETDLLAGKCLLTAGLGSVGSGVPVEGAKLGVENHIVMDHDRVEGGNVMRHLAGLSDVGRRKTNVIAERIREKIPWANVETCDQKITRKTQDLVRALIRRADVVVCGLDDRDGRDILNQLCVEENKPLILAGAFRRAHGVQVLVVKPKSTPCYQCFVHALPEDAHDEEISSVEHAERIAYSDRPVAVEPGLSNDLSPVTQMVVKLMLQCLLKDKQTTLRSLDDDLVAPWFIMLNRREAGTDYEHLEPLGFNVDGVHVMQWYGIDLARNPACPVCGDFTGSAARDEGFDIRPEQVEAFASAEDV